MMTSKRWYISSYRVIIGTENKINAIDKHPPPFQAYYLPPESDTNTQKLPDSPPLIV